MSWPISPRRQQKATAHPEELASANYAKLREGAEGNRVELTEANEGKEGQARLGSEERSLKGETAEYPEYAEGTRRDC